MKKNIISLVSAVLALLFAGTACEKEFDTVLNTQKSTDTDVSEYLPKITYGSMKLGTFNLLISTKGSGTAYDWSTRKTVLAKAIVENDFDVFGFQEADKTIREQLPNLVKEAIPQGSTRNYEWWFVCRDNQAATSGEGLGIAYDANKYELSDKHYFWLTDKDPDVMNVGWDETNYHRMAACAVVSEKENPAKKFFLMVTHMPLASVARQGSATLISTREEMYNKEKLPAFLVGDMNATPDDPATATFLNAKWNDSFVKVPASAKVGNVITFHGQKDIADMTNAEKRIDYIYYKNIAKVLTYKVDYNRYNGYYPSDHCPVTVTFDIPEIVPPAPTEIQGTGTEEDPYQITSVEDWATVATSMNGTGSFSAEACYKLTANLQFSGDFVRIAEFSGVLDGAGHSMVGITGEAEAENFGGVINVLGATGVVKDLYVEANLSSAYKNLGGVVGIDTAGSLIDGVTFKGNLAGSANCSRIGGIIGTSYSVIVNCGCLGGSFEAPSATKSENIGGIAGRIEQNTAVMANCYSFLDKIVSSNNNLGGITGGLGTNAYCVNVYGITSDITGGTATGCIGYSKSGNIRNAYSATDKYVGNDKQASDWYSCGASLSLDNMKSGAVTLPSSGVSYDSFVAALNAGIEDWNALENLSALTGNKETTPYGIVNKPSVTLRQWKVGENGYPVVSSSSVAPGPGPEITAVTLNVDEYAPEKGWESGKTYDTVKLGDVTMTASWEGETTNGVYFVGTAPTRSDWRFYQARKGGLTIAVPEGKELVSVTFTYTNKNNGIILAPDGETTVASGAKFTLSGKSVMFTASSTTSTAGQARINEITVEYK